MLTTRTPSAALQTIESAAGSEIGPRENPPYGILEGEGETQSSIETAGRPFPIRLSTQLSLQLRSTKAARGTDITNDFIVTCDEKQARQISGGTGKHRVGNRDTISLLGRLTSGLLSILIASLFPSALDQLAEQVQVVRVVQVPAIIGFAGQRIEPDSLEGQAERGGALTELILMTVPTDPKCDGPRGEGRGLTVRPRLAKPDSAGKVQSQVGLTRRLTADQPGDGGVSRRHAGRSSFFLWVGDDVQVGKLNHAWRGNPE